MTEAVIFPSPELVLACPMDPHGNDAGASTIREYLVLLLSALLDETDGFSAKHPFGNSDWIFELYTALAREFPEDFPAEFDEDGRLNVFSETAKADEALHYSTMALRQ
jgi:hypothetical protein